MACSSRIGIVARCCHHVTHYSRQMLDVISLRALQPILPSMRGYDFLPKEEQQNMYILICLQGSMISVHS